MSQGRLSMRKIREVLRLKWTCNLLSRAIGCSCHIYHSIVREYLKRTEAAELKCLLQDVLDEKSLYDLLYLKYLGEHPLEFKKRNLTLSLL